MEYGYLDKEVKALVAERDRLTAERDRLAAEKAELRDLLEISRKEALELRKHRKPLRELAAANAILDRLREAIGRQHAELFYVTAAKELSVGFDSKG